MKKNCFKILILVLLVCIAMLAVVGCSGKNEKTENGTATQPTEQYVELSESQITLDKSNDYTLQCTVVGVSDPVVWTSSDENVATVESGKIVALAAGETEIFATAGNFSAKCTVKVEDKGVVPAMQNYSHDFEIRRTSTYDVSPTILFAGLTKNVSDAALTYEVTDSTVATIDANGIATALKEGTTTFTVSGSFRGIKMLPVTGTIVVKKNIVVAMNSLNVNVYACDPDGTYETQFQLESAVFVENKLQSNAELVWSSEDEKIATVENGLITAHRAGTVMINAAYTTADGDVINAGVVVNVERPVIELYDLYEFDLSNKGGSSTMNLGEWASYVDGMFTGFYDITDGTRQEIAGASYKGKLRLPNKSFTEHGFRRYALESELVSIHFDGLAITKKIYTISDLASIATSGNTLDGYYRLEKDIDANGQVVTLIGSWTNSSTKGFIGTFEGNGHTISNLGVEAQGLFNCIGAATIRNLGLANVSGSNRLIATEVHGATIENVAVSSKDCQSVFGFVGSRSKISNLVAVLEEGKYVIQTYGSASDAENVVQNFTVVAGKAEANNGWSGTRVPGIFYNYYQKDDPKALYDMEVYTSKEDMIRDLKNGIPARLNFGIRLDGSKVCYNKAVICQYEMDVTAPETVHRGSSCTIKAQDATFSLKTPVNGISINKSTGVVTVAKDVPEFTEFTVVVKHKQYADVRAEVTIRVTINYKPVQTDVVMRYDLSTGAETYSFTIPEFADTLKRISWTAADGVTEGVTVEDGTFTLTADAVKAVGCGDGKLGIYTMEENVFYVDAVIADKFIYTYDDLAALYQAQTITGYYMLANDIVADNTKALTLIGTWTNKSEEGFLGTFNGDGHIISNIKVGSAGLFGYIGGTGVVKNLALVNVYGGTNAIANEAHGMTLENLFISSPDAARVVNYAGGSSTKNVIAVLSKGQQYIVTDGSTTDLNTHSNIISVVSNPVTNNGWSGTKVVGFFLNYYSFDNPNSKYNLKHYYTAADLLAALAKNNALTSWTDSSFAYENGAVLFNGNMVIVPEITVTGPSIAYRGQTTKLESADAIFSLKEAVEGIAVAADGTITVADDVPELTKFTVVAAHKIYSQFAEELTLTVAIDYNEIDQTDIPVEFDLSTDAIRYRYTIPNFEGTYKAIGWEGEGFIDANGVSVQNGQLTMTKIAMAAIGSGSGTLCVYTEEEDVYLLNVTIADIFIDTLDELKSIATGGKLTGYYVLNSDIDCGGESIVLSCYTTTADNGFVGTFDGRGHIISNVNVGTTGFFWGLGAGTVKNLALVDVIGTGSAIASEIHGATLENIYISSDSCMRVSVYTGESTIKDMIVVLPEGKYVVQTFGAANVNNTISNVYSVIAEPVTNSGWSGTKVVGFFENYYKNDDPKALHNLRHYTTVADMLDAMTNSGALSAINGSFDISDYCLTFDGKRVLMPFSIQCPDEVAKGATITAQAPNATFALKDAVDGISINANTGEITVDATVEPGTTFVVVAVDSNFPGYTAEKTVTVVVNWQNVDWTGKGSIADIVKGTQTAFALPEAISGTLTQIAYGESVIDEGFSYADGMLTLTADLVDAIYAELGYGEKTLKLYADSDNCYAITVTFVTKMISNQADLQSIAIDGTLDGYYVLTNDIVCDGTTEIILAGYTSTTTGGFIGTFDGRGHTISNAYVGTQGFFRGIGAGTVKNVAFVNVISDNVNRTLANETHGCTFENVFVSSNAKYMLQTSWDSPTFKNVVFISSDGAAGRVFNEGDRGTLTATNVFMVGQKLCYFGGTLNETNVKAFASADTLLTAIGAAGELDKWTGSTFTFADGKLLFNGKTVVQ